MKKVECFKIQLLDSELLNSENDIFDLAYSRPIFRKICSHSFFALNPTIIEADPFYL